MQYRKPRGAMLSPQLSLSLRSPNGKMLGRTTLSVIESSLIYWARQTYAALYYGSGFSPPKLGGFRTDASLPEIGDEPPLSERESTHHWLWPFATEAPVHLQWGRSVGGSPAIPSDNPVEFSGRQETMSATADTHLRPPDTAMY